MYLSVLFANAVIDFPDGRVWLWSGAAHHGPNLIQAEEEGFQGFPGFPGFPGGYKVFQVATKFSRWLQSLWVCVSPGNLAVLCHPCCTSASFWLREHGCAVSHLFVTNINITEGFKKYSFSLEIP